MIEFQVTGTMQIEAEKAGVYTSSRAPDGDGMALVAADPVMAVKTVKLVFNGSLTVQAECVFTHTIGTVEKVDSITFALEAAVLGSAVLPLSAIAPALSDTSTAAEWYTIVTTAIAPGIVGALTDGVTATQI